jgi:hypothetical protein
MFKYNEGTVVKFFFRNWCAVLYCVLLTETCFYGDRAVLSCASAEVKY